MTSGVKGAVAVLDAAFTGDRDALNAWGEQAKAGDMGWLIKSAANNETVASAVSGGAEAVISRVGSATTAVGNAVSSASSGVARGWRALTSW